MSWLALEPRIMFDGAAVATASTVTTEQVAQQQTDAAASPDDATTADPTPEAPAPTGEPQFTADDKALFDALAAYDQSTARQEVVFVSSSVLEYQKLVDGISPNVEVHILDSSRDGVQQMAEILAGRTNIDAIHLIGEGTEAEMHLGASFLTQDSISTTYAQSFQQIGQSLSQNADLLIYGSSFGHGDAGQLALNTLAQLTGADVAASKDQTGSAAERGNWQLEVSTGPIETAVVISASTQATWDHALSTFAGTNTNDTGAASQDNLVAAVPQPGATRHEIAFVDTSIKDYEALLADVNPNATVVLLDGSRDGIQQIADYLTNQQNVDAIHIVSHGSEGSFQLGTAVLNADSMSEQYAALLGEIGSHLSANSDILVYGCDFGKGDAGQEAMIRLASLTGADVEASDDLTGAAQLGGDWVLELSTGQIETGIVFSEQVRTDFDHVLVPPVAVDDAYSVNEDTTLVVGPPTTNLANYWKFNDGGTSQTAVDSGSFGNNGTLGSTAGVDANDPAWTGGYVGTNALSFDGTTDYVSTNSTIAKTASSFTLSAWFQTNTTTGSHHILWEGYTGGNGYGNGGSTSPATSEMSLSVGGYNASYDNKIVFSLGYDVPPTTANSIFIASASNFTDTAGWHHVAVTVSDVGGGLKSASLYVDGQLEGTDPGSENDRSVWNSLLIGGTSSGTRLFGGKIDEVRIYDTALSGAQVQSIAQAGVLQNDSDIDSPLIKVNTSVVTGPANGSLSINSDGSFTYTPNVNFSGINSFTYKANDGTVDSNVATVTITVNPVNDAPVLDNTKSPTLTAQNEDSGAPSGAVGTLVSSLVDFASPAGQVDNVTEVDSGAVFGIAITAVDTTNGTWFYSTNNGVSWNALGAVTNSSARLLAADANTRLYFQPNADYNGSLPTAITFRAWDQTSGANGGTADTSTNGGTTAFSTATDTASLTINPVNDAPVNTVPGPQTVVQDIALPISGVSVTDVDGNLATTQLTVTNGTLTVDLAGGATVSAGANGTNTLTLAGTEAQINAALATLTYQGTWHFTGGDTLTVTSRDANAVTDVDTVALTVTPNTNTPGVSINVLNPTPVGNEILVNTTVSGDQWNYYWSIRTVAVASDGSFVKVWIDTGGADGSQYGVFGQRFDVNGNKLGGEFLVNTTTGNKQDNASVAMAPDGSFIVLWDSPGDGGSTGIFGQRFAANGTRVGGEFLVNTTTFGQQQYPELDFADDGSFVASWVDSGGANAQTVFQRFDAAGVKVGGEVLLSTVSGTDQVLDSLEVKGDGSFLVTWTENGDVYGRLYDANTNPVTAQFRINQFTAGSQQYSVVRADSAGNFVVVWESNAQDGSLNGVYARRFAADGTALGNEFAVPTNTVGDQYGPTLAMDRFGNFVVSWTDGNALDGSAESVWMQRFDANGNRVGSSVQVNQTAGGYQAYPVMDMNDDGRLVMAWEGNGPGDTYGVFVRLYQLNPVVTEGSTAQFTVVLNTAPTAPVTLNLSVSDVTEATLSTNTLVFNGVNWNIPQVVTITGLEDWIIDGDQSITLVTASTSSADPTYNGINASDFPVLVKDSGTPNSAPVLDGTKTPVLTAINEDAGAPVGAVGTLVSSLVDFAAPAGQVDNVTDPNAGQSLGIAITAADTTNGTWYYSTNGGIIWVALGAVTNTSARLLAADASTRLYFQPNADYNGTIANAITFRAWDRTSGANGGTADTSTTGGTTAFSTVMDTASLTVNPVNDAPVLTGANNLGSINEDATNLGMAVSALIAGNVTDVDSGAVTGIAVIAVDNSNGTWQYSTDGALSWQNFGSPSTTQARLLETDANTIVRFVPNADWNGTVTNGLTFRAWDHTSGTPGGVADTTINGGTSAFSTNTASSSITVNPVNDAPVLDNTKSPTLTGQNEDSGAPVGAVGTLVSALVDFASPSGQVDNVTDIDSGALLGIAVTAADTTNGTWFYSTNNGTSWNALGAVSDTSARLLTVDANTRLYFQPNADYNGSLPTAITFRAWDRTSGANGGAADTSTTGGTTAFSTATDTASLTITPVNDAPTITNLAGDSLAYNEGDGAVVIEQGANAVVADVDSADFNSGTLTVSFTAGSDSAEDVLAIRNQGAGAGQIGVSGANVTYQGVTIGTFTGGSSGANLVITFNASATPTAVTALVQNITYQDTDTNAPTTGARTVRFVLTDGDGGTSANYDTTVTVSGVNDAPVVAGAGGTLAYTEGDGPQVIDATLTITDVDDTNIESATVSLTGGFVSGEDVLAFTNTGTITGSYNVGTGILTLTGTDTLANYEAALESLTYENTNTNNPNTGTRTVTWVVNDGNLNSAGVTSTITVAAVNDAPVVASNTGSTVAQGGTDPITTAELQVTDVDNTPAQLTYTVTVAPVNGQLELTTAPGVAIISFTQAQINAGQVVYVHNGSFTASDNFTFTVSDGAGGNIGATTFGFTVTSVNSAPTLAVNAGSTVVQGLTDVITAGELQVADLDNTPAQLVYTVTTAPLNGQLELTTAPGVAITTFTQADIDAGWLVFVHSGAAATSDSFTFTVSDGAGGTIGASTFTLTVSPFFPPPGGGDSGSGGGDGSTGGSGGSDSGPGPGSGTGSGPGGNSAVVPPPIQPPPALIGAGVPGKELSVVGATNDPLPRAVIANRTVARIEQPTLGIQEPPARPAELFSLPVKKVLAVGHKLVERLTKLADDLERGIQEREHQTHLLGRVASFSGMALSAGFVAWILRGGSLLASFLVSMPAWRHFDPLPVLGIGETDRRKHDRKTREEDEQENRQFRGLDRVLKSSNSGQDSKRRDA